MCEPTPRTMKSYPVEDGTIEMLVHKAGTTYGLKVRMPDFSNREDLLAQLHIMCSLADDIQAMKDVEIKRCSGS